MPLLKRLQRNFATWMVPVACAMFGSGFGISRAILACDAPIPANHIDEENGTSTDSVHATEACDEDRNVPRLLADIDGDGSVDAYDLMLILADYGLSGPVAGDLNDDGQVDSNDLTALIRHFTS